ncbi:MAG: molybdopterin-synthase adenylyltransferase MoeB [Flavobacteriales bacterium]|nr:molybdopterin-synthase adenylyltransferase MoeB [Flavobacteriales bacterium]
MFSTDELKRYSRHLLIPQLGTKGQEKLKKARVLVIGAGGLGSPVLLYLTAAGVGNIGIVDYDTIDESNLQRQVLFTSSEVGKLKTEIAKNKLTALNPHIQITTYNTRFNSSNALEIIKNYDIVADGTDNFATRYLVNDACVLSEKINVFASIYRFEGQVSVFNLLEKEGARGPNYRDIFPSPPPPGAVPNCAEAGVLGVLPGIIGAMQASEIIKVITGIGEPLSGKMFILDTLSMQNRVMKINKNPQNPLNGEKPTQKTLIDYELFCNTPTNDTIKEISTQELKQKLDTKQPLQLLDVREPAEREAAHIGGDFIPMNTIPLNLNKIKKDVPVIVYCRSGIRSAKVIEFLQEQGFTNTYNLKGGISAWAKEIDNKLPFI